MSHLVAGRHPSALPGHAARRRRRGWVLVGVVAAAVGLLAALFASGLGRNPDTVRPVLLGKPAPSFSLPGLGGGPPVSLASLHGQVVVLNFWSSWCVTCRQEQPALAETWRTYRDQGVVLLGVSFQDQTGPALAYARRYSVAWPLVGDPGSRAALAYGVNGPPTTVVISPSGRIAGVFTGPVSYPALSNEIQRLLPGGA